MSLEITHTNSSNLSREKVTLTAPAYGAITGVVGHASGGFALGSNIPAGRFVVNTAASMASTTRNERSVMLPDQAGTSLFEADGTTDFSATIANALDASSLFPFIGVSTFAGNTCKPAMEIDGTVNGSIPQAKPIGYADEDSKWNYYPIRTHVDILTEGTISVYCETDTTPADSLWVRVAITDADQVPPQLLGGVTNVVDAITAAATQPAPAGVRIESGCVAGSSLMIQLGSTS